MSESKLFLHEVNPRIEGKLPTRLTVIAVSAATLGMISDAAMAAC
jgi:hypothetical protein